MTLSKLAFFVAFVLFVSNLSQGIRGDGPDEYSWGIRLIAIILIGIGYLSKEEEE